MQINFDQAWFPSGLVTNNVYLLGEEFQAPFPDNS